MSFNWGNFSWELIFNTAQKIDSAQQCIRTTMSDLKVQINVLLVHTTVASLLQRIQTQHCCDNWYRPNAKQGIHVAFKYDLASRRWIQMVLQNGGLSAGGARSKGAGCRVARGSPGVLGSAEELTSVAHRPPPRQEQFLVCLGNNSSSQPQPTATATADHGRIDSEESFLLSADIVGDSFFSRVVVTCISWNCQRWKVELWQRRPGRWMRSPHCGRRGFAMSWVATEWPSWETVLLWLKPSLNKLARVTLEGPWQMDCLLYKTWTQKMQK